MGLLFKRRSYFFLRRFQSLFVLVFFFFFFFFSSLLAASGYGDDSGGGEGERGVSVRQPGGGVSRQAAGRRGGAHVALCATDDADRPEDPVPWREAGGCSQEIQARCPESRLIAGTGNYVLIYGCFFCFVWIFSFNFGRSFALIICILVFSRFYGIKLLVIIIIESHA